MAANQRPTLPSPSRRQRREPEAPIVETAPDSRSARNRQRREQKMERRFSWLFVLAVGATILYLVSRTPWGMALIRGHL